KSSRGKKGGRPQSRRGPPTQSRARRTAPPTCPSALSLRPVPPPCPSNPALSTRLLSGRPLPQRPGTSARAHELVAPRPLQRHGTARRGTARHAPAAPGKPAAPARRLASRRREPMLSPSGGQLQVSVDTPPAHLEDAGQAPSPGGRDDVPGAAGAQRPLDAHDLHAPPQDDRSPLVDGGGFDLEEPPGTVAREASSGFEDHRHGSRLVEEAQLPLRGAPIGRIEEDASLEEGPVDVRHHRAHVSLGVASLLAGLEPLTELRLPARDVGLVDRID